MGYHNMITLKNMEKKLQKRRKFRGDFDAIASEGVV